jgi:hypothetical protein
MMSHSIVCTEQLDHMFERLRLLDDTTITQIAITNGFNGPSVDNLLAAYRALVCETPVIHEGVARVVRSVGIVGANSVPTALWPYLILATIGNIRVKVKVPPHDVASLNVLFEIIRISLEEDVLRWSGISNDIWAIRTEQGNDVLRDGYWDDCERLLVFGSDATVQLYNALFPEPRRVVGFGDVASILVADMARMQSDDRWKNDFTAFGHIGCLAPRNIFCINDDSPICLAETMLVGLTGMVPQDIHRAVSLRSLFHQFLVDRTDAWLSSDGMWLISSESRLIGTSIPGHLQLVTSSAIQNSTMRFGSICEPDSSRLFANTLNPDQVNGAWACQWGQAQFPTMNWLNSGVSALETLC